MSEQSDRADSGPPAGDGSGGDGGGDGGTARRPDASSMTVASERVAVTRDLTAPPTRFERWFYAGVSGALSGLCRGYFRVRVVGRENIPAEGPYIVAPVHRSYLDFAMALSCSTPRRRMRFVGKDTLWKGSFGRIWTALGGIPVHRGSTDRAALTTCVAVVKAGEPLVLFPEGTRQEGPEVHPLFNGPAFVQARTGAPILPVGIGGSATAMPKGSTVPRPHKVTVVIGEPLPAPAAGADGRAGRRAVTEQTARLHTVVQELFDEAQRLAGTPNR